MQGPADDAVLWGRLPPLGLGRVVVQPGVEPLRAARHRAALREPAGRRHRRRRRDVPTEPGGQHNLLHFHLSFSGVVCALGGEGSKVGRLGQLARATVSNMYEYGVLLSIRNLMDGSLFGYFECNLESVEYFTRIRRIYFRIFQVSEKQSIRCCIDKSIRHDFAVEYFPIPAMR